MILAVDSTSKSASVAVADGDGILYESFMNNGLTHSQTLGPMIKQALRQLGLSMRDMDAVAVTVGPGSFTGVRIGVCTVKGLAFPFGTPCVPFSTMEALALSAGPFEGLVCPVLDARRGQYYNALFERTADGTLTRLCEDRALSHEELEAEMKNFKKKLLLVGDGAEMCYNKLSEKKEAFLADTPVRFPRAGAMAAAAAGRLDTAVDGAALAVRYLRLSQAERERQERLKADKQTQGGF